MSNLKRLTRQTLTIARRDFTSTVFTPTFLLFLFAPFLFMGLSAAIGGMGAASIAERGERNLRIVAIVTPADRAALIAADRSLRGIFRERDAPPVLDLRTPTGDAERQARAALDSRTTQVTAVLFGALDRPTVLHAPIGTRSAAYLASLADQALRIEASGAAPRSTARLVEVARARAAPVSRDEGGFFAVFALFFLTLLLAGQVVSSMAEERSNKVIEVLAAAVPLEAVFLGKLVGMFGVALTFVAFWGTIAANVASVLPGNVGAALAGMAPALGGPAFAALFVAYFTMAYLLLGAVFLGVGSQAATPREIQMLSLPITIFQVAMFGLASAAAANPDGWVASAAAIFPFSSPFAMVARAASDGAVMPHVLALGWQLAWVALTVTIGARAFRRGVLQSAGPKFRWRKGKARA
ncbi:ABC transporter permease [Sphingomonas sp. Y38-1Y]|uniref:ABC transporter permease n=1 Tax=Sphingomonas sp. Y38-1Y TaxID=3078265 RepID=UPI0028F03454|nr:ABC transporter permease [Sphingomonas sp. Y38-1Y]